MCKEDFLRIASLYEKETRSVKPVLTLRSIDRLLRKGAKRLVQLEVDHANSAGLDTKGKIRDKEGEMYLEGMRERGLSCDHHI